MKNLQQSILYHQGKSNPLEKSVPMNEVVGYWIIVKKRMDKTKWRYRPTLLQYELFFY